MARTPRGDEDRREQIMDAALRVFARKGFDRATNKDIAREAGITPGLIYHYFAGKDALLQAAIQARSPVQTVRTLPPDLGDLPPDKFLRVVLMELLNTVEDDKFLQLLRVYLSELLHNPQASALGIPAIQEGTKYLEEYLRAKMKRREIRKTDPALAAQLILGSIMDIVLRRQILQDPIMLAYSHEQIVNLSVELALDGLRVR